jgi:hypothetical protein
MNADKPRSEHEGRKFDDENRCYVCSKGYDGRRMREIGGGVWAHGECELVSNVRPRYKQPTQWSPRRLTAPTFKKNYGVLK